MPTYILLYDGVCGLCNRIVQFVLRRDREQVFRFAALQTQLAARILRRHGENPSALDTVYVVVNYDRPDESLLTRSDAVLFTLKQFPGFWPVLGKLGSVLPRRLRDILYRLVAGQRYGIFGRHDSCPVPSPETKARFLE